MGTYSNPFAKCSPAFDMYLYTATVFKGWNRKASSRGLSYLSWYRVNQETCAVLLLSKRKGNRKPLPSFWSSLEGKSFICIPSTQHFNYGQWFWNSWAFREQRIRHSWRLIRNAFRIQNMNSLNTMISTLHWGKRIKLSKFTITFLKSQFSQNSHFLSFKFCKIHTCKR